jgi:hypothetical protein
MKMTSRHFALFVLGSLLLLFLPQAGGQDPAPPAAVTSEELAVYAVVLDSLPGLGKGTRVLIADSTSTFACDQTICNGFSMGGCNGLRGAGESPTERLAIVKRDLPDIGAGTISSFQERNQRCVAIHDQIPTASDYRYLNDPDIPNNWKNAYIAYFSRVGFNAEHSQALINVVLFSATDAKLSGGRYLMLQMVDGKWVLGGTSAVWALTQ